LKGGPIMGIGNFIQPDITPLDKETGQGKKSVVHFTTGVQVAEVEVDLETGHIDVLRIDGVYDVGKAINPKLIEGQFQGGAVQGLSSALFEQLILKDGKLMNDSFTDYKIATARDVPYDMKYESVESLQKDGPYGARGVGEHTMVPTAPAIANAVFNATGIRVKSMPITAEKLRMAIKSGAKEVA